MAEEETTPAVEPQAEVTTQAPVNPAEIQAVEKEIEIKDNAKLEGVKKTMSEEFRNELEQMRASLDKQYTEKLNEQIKAVKDSYDEKLTSVEGKLEDLKSRKGFVDVPSESPLKEINDELEQKQQSTEPDKKDPFSIRKFTRSEVEATGNAFLANLRN